MAEACSDVLIDGWQSAVNRRVSGYVTEATWRRMFRRRKRRHCRRLAKMATKVLAGKRTLHQLVGTLFARIASRVGVGRVPRTFVRKLAEGMPMPLDEQMIAVARGLQVTGILLCVADDEDLSRCQCFIDLSLAESKATVKKILTTAMRDWTDLKEFSANRGFHGGEGDPLLL